MRMAETEVLTRFAADEWKNDPRSPYSKKGADKH